MKTREQILEEVLALKQNNIVLSMSTGVGKSRIALKKAKSLRAKLPGVDTAVLIVSPTNTIIDSWKKEIVKWKATEGITYDFTTYASLHKHANFLYDMVVFDEGHHITERVLDIIKLMHFSHSMILSATIKPILLTHLRILLPDLTTYRVRTKDAIDNNILPDPKILLLPLHLRTTGNTEQIIKNPKVEKSMVVEFAKRGLCRDKRYKYIIPCTEQQYNLDMDTQVDWYKRKAMGGNQAMKNLWLHKAGDRLKWLASKKNPYVTKILEILKDIRSLTFCASIEQTELLGSNCIHSKNKKASNILDSFNNGDINHITAVAMLDEGVNVSECQVGIFANINSSERIQIQRVGRILRHSNPIIIIPYFLGTREEEIVERMLEGYTKDLIFTLRTFNDFSEWIYKYIINQTENL